MTVADGEGAAPPRAASPAADPDGEASRLARELQYLTWPDRASALDAWIWASARMMLSSDEVTAVINRQRQGRPETRRVAGFSTRCGAVVTALLAPLSEPRPVTCAPQALTLLLSHEDRHREAAIAWVRAAGIAELEAQLSCLPGYAFLFLTIYPNDSAESFMARDAFRAAVLGTE
jgi:hypothetical protein